MSDRETCSEECDAEATHEAREAESEPWRPVCEDHALGLFEWGETVRKRPEGGA
jgi:hypothetical protein